MCQLSQIILIQKSPGYRPRLIHQPCPLKGMFAKNNLYWANFVMYIWFSKRTSEINYFCASFNYSEGNWYCNVTPRHTSRIQLLAVYSLEWTMTPTLLDLDNFPLQCNNQTSFKWMKIINVGFFCPHSVESCYLAVIKPWHNTWLGLLLGKLILESIVQWKMYQCFWIKVVFQASYSRIWRPSYVINK